MMYATSFDIASRYNGTQLYIFKNRKRPNISNGEIEEGAFSNPHPILIIDCALYSMLYNPIDSSCAELL